MENAVEALKMAGSVLIFVVALSIAILFFTQARTAIDSIVRYSDREYSTIENDDRFFYRKSDDTERYVGMETIIPTIYRAFTESYKIVFKFPDNYYLYKDYTNGQEKEVCKIDTVEHNGISYKQDFLTGILYGQDHYNPDLGNFGSKNKRILNTKNLYKYLSEKESHYKIKETLGTYYMEDVNGISSNQVPEVDKHEVRVITYTFKPK